MANCYVIESVDRRGVVRVEYERSIGDAGVAFAALPGDVRHAAIILRGSVLRKKGTAMNACRSCGAPVVWATTVSGKKMMLDVEASDYGNVVYARDSGPNAQVRVLKKGESYAGARYMSHFATCPNAKQHRSKKAKPEPASWED